MEVIKEFFGELFKIIAKAIWGYVIGIFTFTLIMAALNEMFRVFVELEFVQFAGIASILIFILGIVDYWQELEIFEEISEFVKNPRNKFPGVSRVLEHIENFVFFLMK